MLGPQAGALPTRPTITPLPGPAGGGSALSSHSGVSRAGLVPGSLFCSFHELSPLGLPNSSRDAQLFPTFRSAALHVLV